MSDTAAPGRPVLRAWLVIALVAAVLVGLLAALGGFERRQVRWLEAAPGDEIDAGNLVFRFDAATAQHFTKSSDSPWRVVVTGSVRNPHQETLGPLTGKHGNLRGIQPGADPEVAVDWQAGLGPAAPGSVYNPRRTVPPNDHWLRLTATFRFDEFEPSDTFMVGVSPQEYAANIILGLSETPSWNTDAYALPVQVTVPLTRLPDSDY